MKEGFTTISFGSALFIREVSVPVATTIEEALADSGVPHSSDWMESDQVLWLDRGPKADAVLIGGIVGVLCFLGSWAVSKFLDEVYAWKIQPALKRCFESLQAKPGKPSENPPRRSFLFGIWLTDLRVLVAVRLEGHGFEEIAQKTEKIAGVLAGGVKVAIDAKSTAEIHVYPIRPDSTCGRLEVYETLDDALHKRAANGD